MTSEPSSNLSLVQSSAKLDNSIVTFHPTLAQYLQDIGLPTTNVLSPIEERRRVIDQLADVLALLPESERVRAFYLSRFTVAVAAGLFDGALSYLWNETIGALRRLVARIDLQYFFSVAEKVNPRNKNFGTEEDIREIAEHDLLEVCRRIGLISDVNYHRLEQVDYMRNHASAAHPNEIEVSGYELLSMLVTCLKYAITAQPDPSAIVVKSLMDNVRTVVIPQNDFHIIGSEIQRLSQERIDDLLWALFGLFVDPRQTAVTRANIEGLATYVWNASSEDRKYEVGSKFGVYRKNADVARKQSADDFLKLVGGQTYKDEDSLAGELLEKLEMLKAVHFGVNNFYNEFPHAKGLQESLPVTGVVPRAARSTFVKVICMCYVGNGRGYREGVDEAAEPYYRDYIDHFSEAAVAEFLKLMGDPEFTLALDRCKADNRARELSGRLKIRTTNIHMLKALDLLINAPDRVLPSFARTADYKAALQFVPSFE